MMTVNRFKFLQALLFQALWFSCVLLGNHGLALAAALLGLHFYLAAQPLEEARLCVLALLGVVIDASLWFAGVYSFSALPLWLLLLWPGFVLSLGHSLQWLRRLPQYGVALLGAVSGTSSYLAAWRLGAVDFAYGPLFTGLILSLIWMLLLPLLVTIDEKMRAQYVWQR